VVRPHPHGKTERHVYQGPAGLFLLEDPVAVPDLPSRYGVDDIPVVVSDKEFDDDGQSPSTAREPSPD
jgi:FtsP/CotA-like multicopper oxidase with cupredoxin domain